MKRLIFCVSILTLLTLVSCSKNESINNTAESIHDKVALTFDIASIQSPLDLEASVQHVKKSGEIVVEDKSLGEGIYSTSTVSNKINNKEIVKSAATNSTIHMESGTKYFTLIYKYKKINGVESPIKTLVGAGIGQSGTRTAIEIPRPVTTVGVAEPIWYKAIAFTFNEKNEKGFPNLDSVKNFIGSEFNHQLNIPTNRALYIFSGDYNLGLDFNATYTNGQPVIKNEANFSFTFRPITAKFTLNFDAQSTYNKFKEIGGVVTAKGNFFTGVVNLNDASENLTPINYDESNNYVLNRFMFNTSFSGSIFTASGNLDPVNKIEFSTYLSVAGNKSFQDLGLNVTVNHLKIIDENNLVKYNVNSTTGTPLNYGFNNLKFQNKYQSIGNVYIYEGFKNGNTLWSLANLYYDINATIKHKFRSGPEQGRGIEYINTDYWRPNYVYPTSKLEADKGDPCSKAYPSGWRLPTTNEIDAMLDKYKLPTGEIVSKYVRPASLSSDVRTHYVEFTNSSTNQVLRFYGAGYVVGNSIVNFGPGGEESTGSSAGNSAIFLSGSGVGFFDRDYVTLSFTLWRTLLTSNSAGWSDSKTNYTYIDTRFNVRCVRDI